MAAHEFALFWSQLSEQTGSQCTITGADIVHQLVHVLRVHPDDRCIVFDEYKHAHVRIARVARDNVVVDVLSEEKNRALTPYVHVALGVLKKPALEEAVYALTELGATSIQLLLVHHAQHKERLHDSTRLRAIMIAAAQQSKQFVLPTLHAPRSLHEVLSAQHKTVGVLCDAHASQRLVDAVAGAQEITLFVGPESDFTHEEKQLICQSGAKTCRLTPTILRAQQAAAVAVGIIRSQ